MIPASLLTAIAPGVRPVFTAESNSGSPTIWSTSSMNGLRTFSRVFALASQNFAPCSAASAWPSSRETTRALSDLSSLVPTCTEVNFTCRKGLPVGMRSTAYQVQGNVGDGVHLGFLKPLLQRQEACPAGDVVDEYDAMRPAVEACRQSSKPLLPSLAVCVSPRKGPREQQCRVTMPRD